MKLSDFNLKDTENQLAESLIKEEEKIIKDLLRQLLKREPVIEDFKKCHKLYQLGLSHDYDFASEGVILGKVYFDFKGYTITFEPNEMFK